MSSWGQTLAAMAAVVAAVSLRAAPAPAIHVEPGSTVLDGDPVHVSLSGLDPRAEVTLIAERWVAPLARNPRARLMRSEATFAAGEDGRLDLRSAAPSRGTWRDADRRGPFWSMLPVPGVERAAPGTVDTTEVRFTLKRGDATLATAQVRLRPALPEVVSIPVEEFPGAVFATLPGPGKRPALILLGGSEGGTLITHAAAPFASRGFAVLALPVFSPPDRAGEREVPALPAGWTDVPVETLERAREWLARRPEVDAKRIGLHGTSMGAVLVLLGAAHLPWVGAVAASVPSDIVWEGWGPGVAADSRSTFSLAGKPLPFVPLVGYDEEVLGSERQQPVIIRRPHERGRAVHADRVASARIPVERIRGPVLVIAGDDDQMWPSGAMARNIVERRREAGLATEALVYPAAGHSLYDTGYAPTTQYNAGFRKTGGTPEANARAQAEAWTRTFQFLHRNLAQ